MAFGEFNSARLKPTWESKTKAGDDKSGWQRGGREWTDGEAAFMKTFDREADDFMYGKSVRNRRPDGAQRVTFNAARDPGKIHDHGKGAVGVDSAGSRNRPDDGV
jgi:hypothetical protein